MHAWSKAEQSTVAQSTVSPTPAISNSDLGQQARTASFSALTVPKQARTAFLTAVAAPEQPF